MKRWLTIAAAAVLLASGPTHAYWQSRMQVSVGVAAYTGPGDIVSGASGWWGLRAYSLADRGNPLINVCNVADVACADLSSDATTGALVITTIGGSSCSVVTCTIKTFYDRSGNANDITQATISKRPTLTVSCAITAKPCAAYTNAAVTVLAKAGGPTVAQPFTYSAVAVRTGANTAFGPLIATNNGADGEVTFGNGLNSAHLYCSSAATHLTASPNDGTWYSFQGLCNGASSVISVNGTETSGSAGAGSFNGTILVGNDGGASLTGNMVETGIWPSGFSAGNRTSMTSNQRTFWGI